MQITVKSIKVLKEGKSEFGEWTLVGITTDEDVQYTTLAKEAGLISPGVTLKITNMDKDEQNRESFKKFEYVTGGPKAETASKIDKAPSPYQGEMTPELWSEKDRITRTSIEGQNALTNLTNLTVAGIKLEDCPSLLSNALRAKIGGFTEVVASNPNPSKPVESTPKTQAKKETKEEAPTFKNIGEVLNAYVKKGGTREEALEIWGVKESDDLSKLNLIEAWEAVNA